jgi:hypothetical protein
VSFQITILKVLAGHPDGRASVTDLTRYVGVLMSNRMRNLAARAPKLDIVVNAFVLRDANGWQITGMGRRCLVSLDVPIPAADQDQSSRPDVPVLRAPSPVPPVLRLVVDNMRTRDPAAGQMKHGGLPEGHSAGALTRYID